MGTDPFNILSYIKGVCPCGFVALIASKKKDPLRSPFFKYQLNLAVF